MENFFGELSLTRLLIQKGMAIIYFLAFLSAFNQGLALLGKKGLEPIPAYLKKASF